MPSVGVVGITYARAKHVAAELGIDKPVLISTHSTDAIRGRYLDALIIDHTVTPLPDKTVDEIVPALMRSDGGCNPIYELHRGITRSR